jgi:hypothetical protein
MALPQVGGGGDTFGYVAATVFNKKSRTANKEMFYNLGGWALKNKLVKK